MYISNLRMVLVVLFMIFECLKIGNSAANERCITFDKESVSASTPGEVFQGLRSIGYQQCVRECIKASTCGGIIYNRTDLFCGMLSTVITDLPNLMELCFKHCPPEQSCVTLTRRKRAFCIQDTPTLPCQIGDLHFEGNCYFFGTDYLNWTNANDICKSMNGHLATVDTETVNKALTRKLVELGGTWRFIGAIVAGVDADWRWTENDKLLSQSSFENWGSIYPIVDATRLCGTLTLEGDWVNMECYIDRLFICQYSQ